MAIPAANPVIPPMPYVVASWLGYPVERIVAGLRRGSIAPPLGAPPGWLPPGAEAIDAPPEGDPAADDGAASPPSAVDAGPSDGATAAAPPEGDLRTAYFDLVRSIDPSAGDEALDRLWQAAGGDDAARAVRVGEFLWRTVTGGPAAAAGEPGGVEALAAAIAERGTRGTLISLAGDGSAALAARARSDPAALRALASLDAYAFADVEGGASVALPSEAGDRAAPFSDAWIDDRAKFLAWREAIAADPAAGRDTAATWTFVDRTLGDAATVVVGDDPASANRVVFAREGGDRYVGGASVDRIHGAGGDDVLRGAAGDDLIEGAGGDDVLSGGAGRDRLDGGAGADEISGGSGGDALDGGEGDDVLDGGRGDDALHGGRGRDTYEFARGDGVDVVDDADGDGVILLDGERLAGDASDGVSYATHEEAGSTTLVIRTGDAGGEIRIRDWREGLFGIRLEDRPGATDGAETPAPIDVPPGTKPLVSSGESGADAEAAFPVVGREPGNESGSVSGIAGDDASDIAVAASRGGDRYGVLGIADWLEATRAPQPAWDDAAHAPPGVDPAGVTTSDLASALAGTGDGHDDAESAGLRHGPSLWTTADDWSTAIAPPEAPGRPHR